MKKSLLMLIFLSTGIVASEKSNVKSRLISAVQKGQIVETRKLLDEGYDINGRDSVGNTPLIYATMFGFNDIVTLLLSRGADTQIANKKGEKAENFLKKPADDSKKPNSYDLIKKEAINPEDLSFDEINKIEEDPKKAQELKEKYKDTFNKIANPGIESINLKKNNNLISKVLEGGQKGYITSVEFNHDGKYLASSAEDGTVCSWNLEDLTYKKLEGYKVNWNYLDASDNASDNLDILLRIKGLDKIKSKVLEACAIRILSVAVSSDGKYLATASIDEAVNLWDLSNLTYEKLKGHTLWVNSVAFSPDSRYLATGSGDGTARLWYLKPWIADEFSLAQLLFVIKMDKVDADQDISNNQKIFESFSPKVKDVIRRNYAVKILDKFLLKDLILMVLGYYNSGLIKEQSGELEVLKEEFKEEKRNK